MKYLFPILLGIAGAAVLVSLGIWQVQRLAWKEALLAEIDATISGEPQVLPADPTEAEHQSLPVIIEGTTSGEELHVLVSVKGAGAGFLIVQAFETGEGRRVLLDRGFVRSDQKSAERPQLAGQVVGNLRWPDDRNSSTPDNDPDANYWYARDIVEMADRLKTEPVLVIARSSDPVDRGATPLPLDSSGVPNDHFEYAVTWFGLAAVWIGMTLFWLWRISRSPA